MSSPANDTKMDVESRERFVQRVDDSLVGLEPVDGYVRRIGAAIRLSKARAANWIAYILVGGIVASLPVYALVACFADKESAARVAEVFDKWYDVVGPLLGAVIGALFGMSIAQRKDEVD